MFEVSEILYFKKKKHYVLNSYLVDKRIWLYLGKNHLRCGSPLYNHMEKADFLYFEVEDPNEINLITFRDSSVIVSAKISETIKVLFWVINLLML